MSEQKRWTVSFHVTTVATDEFEAVAKARRRVTEDQSVPYVECFGPATREDIDDDEIN